MREWNNIHGFPIVKDSPKPPNRMNFIFLKNPNDVQKAVMKQFERYISFPQRYDEQWQSEPNIEESLRKFDQTGVDGKMKFLKAKFPSINFSLPLSTIFDKISINDL